MEEIKWNRILDTLEKNINEQSFKTWFQNTKLIDKKNKTLTIKVPTKFTAGYLNKNYTETLSEVVYNLYSQKYNIKFTSKYGFNEIKKEEKETNIKTNYDKYDIKNKLNPKYTFEQFIVGKSNSFAHSAAMAVAESPGSFYNPLFIYGESGMGKTHLMQAIAHFGINNGINKSYFYTTSEEFTNELIEALGNKTMQQFRKKYRNFDILLIDDVHFLSKKEATQEEFFHTFNALYENKKQIILTSDRPPKDIPDLEERIITRFEWGLLTDLKSPDLETRIAILKKKAELENIFLPADIINFIAENVHSNVRALEGSLIRITAYASYNKIDPEEMTVAVARDVLKDMISEKEKEISLDKILQNTCNTFNLTPALLLDKTRKRNIAFPRQIAMYLSNLLIPQLSLKEIANYFKRKDHTTVLHAKKTVESRFRKDEEFRSQIETLINDIKT